MQLAVTTTSRIYKITGKLRIVVLERKWAENYVFGHIPRSADVRAFQALSRNFGYDKSRHGVMLKNDITMERLFYIFDNFERGAGTCARPW